MSELCVECNGPVDRSIPNPIPDGYELMLTEAFSGKALYCTACFDSIPLDDQEDADA